MTILITRRLKLITMAPDYFQESPQAWPDPELVSLLRCRTIIPSTDPMQTIWCTWLIVHRVNRVIIGEIGFKGLPDSTGTVELEYGLLPRFQHFGYATEAVGVFIAWAVRRPEVRRILAACLCSNIAAQRSLEKLGARRISEDGIRLMWEVFTT